MYTIPRTTFFSVLAVLYALWVTTLVLNGRWFYEVASLGAILLWWVLTDPAPRKRSLDTALAAGSGTVRDLHHEPDCNACAEPASTCDPGCNACANPEEVVIRLHKDDPA